MLEDSQRVRLLVLASLAEEPKHGYAITQDIADTMGVRLSAGTLYAVISRLESRGLIEPLESDDRRRPYRLTAAGASELAEQSERMHQVSSVPAEAAREPRLGRRVNARRIWRARGTGVLARVALGLYPPTWRIRYGDEVRALLEDSGAGVRATASLAWHAAPAWAWPARHLFDRPGRMRASLATEGMAWALLAGLEAVFVQLAQAQGSSQTLTLARSSNGRTGYSTARSSFRCWPWPPGACHCGCACSATRAVPDARASWRACSRRLQFLPSISARVLR